MVSSQRERLTAAAISPLCVFVQVHQYRVAMTAKDCSIMVALVPRSEEEDDDEG